MIESFIHLFENSLGKFLSYSKLVELSSKFNVPLAPPLTASISLTLRCNSRCSYCEVWRIKEDFQEVPLDNLDRVFRSLSELGVRIVSLTGGEPLTRNDLERIIALAKYYELLVHVDTNGVLLTRERALRLKQAGLDSVALSLDSLDPEVYERLRGVPFRLAERALASLLYVANKYPSFWGNITCVVTRYNIGTLVPFVKQIAEYGGGRISVTLQPYHRPPPFPELSQLYPKLQKVADELLPYYQDKSQNDLIPRHKLRPVFESDIQELIQLKKLKPDFPLHNSEFYLKSMPDFLFDYKLPHGLNCVTGYAGIVIRTNLEVCPCWRLPPVGDLEREELSNIWFSKGFRKQRIAMKHLKCSGCMLLCHNEPGFYAWHDMIYKAHQKRKTFRYGG